MKRPTIRPLPLFFLLIGGTIFGFFTNQSASGQISGIDWEQDISKAFADARAQDKLVLVHFTASWSKKSRDLQTFVFKNSRVTRAIKNNVIPVLVDIDQFPDLGREYGIEEVPYDLVLTPGKRVVARRPSPSSSDNYALMIEKLERTINLIKDKGLGAVDKNVDGLNELVSTQQAVKQHSPFSPMAPTQRPPAPSMHSSELLRTSQFAQNNQGEKVLNQFFEPSAKGDPSQDQPVAGNQLASANQPAPQPAQPGSLRILNEKFFAKENDEGAVQNLTPSTMTPNLVATPSQSKVEPKTEATIAIPAGVARQEFVSATNSNVTNPNAVNPNAAESPLNGASHSGAFLATGTRPNSQMLPTSQASRTSPTESTEMAPPQATSVPSLQAANHAALQGHCPVTLVKERRWVKGNQAWGCFHRDRLYFFKSQADQQEFQQAPDVFSPLLAGFDPVVFTQTGQLVDGKEEHGAFLGNPPHFRVVLFSSHESRDQFEADPKKYIDVIRIAMEKAESHQ